MAKIARILMAGGITLSLLAVLPPAHAQEGDAATEDQDQAFAGIEEIVVTARRIEETLQTTGGAVTALTGSEIDRFRVTEGDRLQEIVPNLVYKERDSARGLTIKVRGIGTSDADVPTADPTVAVYIDGVFQPRPFGPQFELFDLERAEILRGPQGTLYGKNALGGAINFITRRPDGEGGFRLRGEYGRFDEFNLEGSAEVTLVEDRLFARFSGMSRTRDGFFNNTARRDQDLATKNLNGGRLDLRYLNNGWDVLLSADLLIKDEVGAPFRLVETAGLAGLIEGVSGTDLDQFIIGPNASHGARKNFPTDVGINDGFLPEGRGARGDPQSTSDNWGVTFIAEKDLRNFDISWTSGYREFRNFDESDVDGTPLSILNRAVKDSGYNVNAELQAHSQFFDERLDLVAGLFGLHEEFLTVQDNTAIGVLFPIGIDGSFERVLDGTTDAFAAYAHGIFWITPKLNFSLGGRFNYEEKSLTLQNGDLTSPGLFNDINGSETIDFSNFQPKFGLDYIVNDDIFLYGVISKGFASGGFQGRPNSGLERPESFDEETLWNFEVGIKSDWFDNRARVNLSAFYMDFSDIVVQSFGPGPADAIGDVGFFLQNSGGATVKGIELESTFMPIPQFRLQLNLGLLDQEFSDFGIGSDGQPVDPDQAEFFDSPDTTIAVIANYAEQLPNSRGEIAISADWSYRSRIFFDNDKTSVSGDGARDIVNARIRYTSPDGKWSGGFYAENLFDEVSILRNLNLLQALGFNVVQFNDPRTMGIFLEYRN